MEEVNLSGPHKVKINTKLGGTISPSVETSSTPKPEEEAPGFQATNNWNMPWSPGSSSMAQQPSSATWIIVSSHMVTLSSGRLTTAHTYIPLNCFESQATIMLSSAIMKNVPWKKRCPTSMTAGMGTFVLWKWIRKLSLLIVLRLSLSVLRTTGSSVTLWTATSSSILPSRQKKRGSSMWKAPQEQLEST